MFDKKAIQRLLSFTNNLRLEINDSNFKDAIHIVDFINSIAPEKKIHLICNTQESIPKYLKIFTYDLKVYAYQPLNNENVEGLKMRNFSLSVAYFKFSNTLKSLEAISCNFNSLSQKV